MIDFFDSFWVSVVCREQPFLAIPEKVSATDPDYSAAATVVIVSPNHPLFLRKETHRKFNKSLNHMNGRLMFNQKQTKTILLTLYYVYSL